MWNFVAIYSVACYEYANTFNSQLFIFYCRKRFSVRSCVCECMRCSIALSRYDCQIGTGIHSGGFTTVDRFIAQSASRRNWKSWWRFGLVSVRLEVVFFVRANDKHSSIVIVIIVVAILIYFSRIVPSSFSPTLLLFVISICLLLLVTPRSKCVWALSCSL